MYIYSQKKLNIMKLIKIDLEELIYKFNSKFQKVSISKIFQILESMENNIDRNLNSNVLYLNLIFEIASLSIRI